MDPKILQKVRHLVKLAASEAEQEARTAAVKACRLILEHGLEIVEKVEAEAKAAKGRRRTPDAQASDFTVEVGDIAAEAAGKVIQKAVRRIFK